MKIVLGVLVFLCLATAQLRAEQSLEGSISSGDLIGGSFNERRINEVLREMEIDRVSEKSSVNLGKRFKMSGPGVRVFKGAKIWNIPARVLHQVNPFAPVEAGEAERAKQDQNRGFWTFLSFSKR